MQLFTFARLSYQGQHPHVILYMGDLDTLAKWLGEVARWTA